MTNNEIQNNFENNKGILEKQEEIKNFSPEKLKNLISNTDKLLTINENEKKEIIRNLGDKAPAFLKEIEQLNKEFNNKILEKNVELENLSNLEYNEQVKLFLDVLNFTKRNERILEKIDDNDGNWLSESIYKTKYDKEKHEGLLNTFDAIKDGLPNGVFLGIQKYENLLNLDFNGIKKLINNLSDLIEEEGIVNFLKLTLGDIGKEFKKLIDFKQPAYIIAQSIGKFLVDIIIGIITGGLGAGVKFASKIFDVSKIAGKLKKIIPDGLVKNTIKKTNNIILKTTDEFIKGFTGIPQEIISIKGLKKLGLVESGKKIGNELMFYSGNIPYIIYKDAKNLKDGLKYLKENGIKIDKILKAPNGDTIVKLAKIEEKANKKLANNYINYLKQIKNNNNILPSKEKILKIAYFAGMSLKYDNRINLILNNNTYKEEKEKIFNELLTLLEKKYQKDQYNIG